LEQTTQKKSEDGAILYRHRLDSCSRRLIVFIVINAAVLLLYFEIVNRIYRAMVLCSVLGAFNDGLLVIEQICVAILQGRLHWSNLFKEWEDLIIY
jgi:hypothetical protein